MSALEKETAIELRASAEPRYDWTLAEVEALYALPLNDLLFLAQSVHRQTFDPNAVQVSTLLSIKTGACPEDCAYCPQSIRFTTDVDRHDLMPLAERHLTEDDWESIATAFRENDNPLFGIKPREQAELLFRKILDLAPAPIGSGH